jgi:hypothetical protein
MRVCLGMDGGGDTSGGTVCLVPGAPTAGVLAAGAPVAGAHVMLDR